ncbi:MAG: hypothetical protein M1814_006294 [Vezdaea aestivalis]|nr:MAG: hypothetical protein M1814_006294 [Vezdaea aestivalis]
MDTEATKAYFQKLKHKGPFQKCLDDMLEELLWLVLSMISDRQVKCDLLSSRLSDLLCKTDFLYDNPRYFPDKETRIQFFNKVQKAVEVLDRRMAEREQESEENREGERMRRVATRPEYERSLPVFQPWSQFLSSGAPGSGTGMYNRRDDEQLQIIPEPGIKILEYWREAFERVRQHSSQLAGNGDGQIASLEVVKGADPAEWTSRRREMKVWCTHQRFTKRPQVQLRHDVPPTMSEYSRLFDDWRTRGLFQREPQEGGEWRVVAIKHGKKAFFDEERGYTWWNQSDEDTDYGEGLD